MSAADEISDGRLFDRARRGDRSAFARLIDRHKDPLVGYLARLAGDPQGAEDLAHEAFLRLLQRGGGYREEGRLRAYLYRIATNLAISERRRERRRRLLRPLVEAAGGRHQEPTQQDAVLRRELRRELAAALGRLPLRYRAPMILAYVEGWSRREIARALGCREGTVKSRLHRGCRRLRRELEPYRQGELECATGNSKTS